MIIQNRVERFCGMRWNQKNDLVLHQRVHEHPSMSSFFSSSVLPFFIRDMTWWFHRVGSISDLKLCSQQLKQLHTWMTHREQFSLYVAQNLWRKGSGEFQQVKDLDAQAQPEFCLQYPWAKLYAVGYITAAVRSSTGTTWPTRGSQVS